MFFRIDYFTDRYSSGCQFRAVAKFAEIGAELTFSSIAAENAFKIAGKSRETFHLKLSSSHSEIIVIMAYYHCL